MTTPDDYRVSPKDRVRLQDLARRVADIGLSPQMDARRDLWIRHNRMDRNVRPAVYINPQGSWLELVPFPDMWRATNRARMAEHHLTTLLYAHEHFASDNVVDNRWIVRKAVHTSGYGLESKWRGAPRERGAGTYDPVLRGPADLAKLRIPTVTHDAEATARDLEWAQELFGDILDVVVKGRDSFDFHLMNHYCRYRGLEEAMVDMAANPSVLHDAMGFFERAHQSVLEQHEAQGLLGLNSDNTPIYTSGHGYSDELPAKGVDPTRVRARDLWSWAEAQETAQVSPAMHEEFSLQYERRLLAPFGLTGYGCCDDLTDKLDNVLKIPNLRKVSISPWSDVERCAAALGDRVIFMWKPQPAHLVGTFDADRVRAYIRKTVDAVRAHGGVLEIALLDTHSCENRPERFDAWSRIAREEVERW